jgi:K(+)-stimulated pyrophosphate-energized sodium pump
LLSVPGPVAAFSLALAGGVLALGWAGWLALRVGRLPAGDARMAAIASAIRDGASAFLKRAYGTVGVFVLALAAALAAAAGLGHPQLTGASAVTFALGAACSLGAGVAGMRVAVVANVRTTQAARRGLRAAFAVAFDGGSVMGFAVAGLGLAGLALALFAFADPTRPASVDAINGFALGASSVALFARVGGGIFTKGADVAADLVGKVEEGLPEDDARNPAVIADNVGDNVGDVAGMGADLFESYVGSLVAAVAIGAALPAAQRPPLLLPLDLAAVALGASWLAGLAVRALVQRDPGAAMRAGTWVAGALFLAGAHWVLWGVPHAERLFGAVACGLALALGIGYLTERATGAGRAPVVAIAASASVGPAPAVIAGLALGMASVAGPVALIAAAILGAYALGGLYGIALAAVGMMATTAITLAVDAYGPIADNAGGIAEMAGLPAAVRECTDRLDAVGNTTAAVGKGIAIGSAALTALALFAAFAAEAHLQVIDLGHPAVVAGLLFGGAIPFLFSAHSLRAVGRAAMDLVAEVRRQLREHPAILRGTERPDYARCVDLSTRSALAQMAIPGLTAVLLPLATGLVLGRLALAGLLAGTLVSGVSLAIAAANAGGAMDNAKKHVEAGAFGGKGTPTHAAAVVGDTVGDPLKDTAGPSLNILIKLMTIVALVFVPLFH